MSLNIDFLDSMNREDLFRIKLSFGNIVVRSSPGSISDNYRDLKANRRFLAERRLAKMFVGEEPLVNISYDNEITATAYIYKKLENSSEKVSSKFQIEDALSHIDRAIEYLEMQMCKYNFDNKSIISQVEEDISHGIYRVYLNDSG